LILCGRLSWLLPAFDHTLISHSYLLTYLPTPSESIPSPVVMNGNEPCRVLLQWVVEITW